MYSSWFYVERERHFIFDGLFPSFSLNYRDIKFTSYDKEPLIINEVFTDNLSIRFYTCVRDKGGGTYPRKSPPNPYDPIKRRQKYNSKISKLSTQSLLTKRTDRRIESSCQNCYDLGPPKQINKNTRDLPKVTKQDTTNDNNGLKVTLKTSQCSTHTHNTHSSLSDSNHPNYK